MTCHKLTDHYISINLRLTKLLGSGQFGNVHQGEWTDPGTKQKFAVAVKTLKEGASEEDKVKFLQEAAIMGQFRHTNVVHLHGVITEGECVSLFSVTYCCVIFMFHNYNFSR